MREIKFRQYLWNDDSKTTGGRMIDWEELLQEAEESLASNFTSKFSNASELMQYTGLKDKNGKEIYEGDIVRVLNNLKEYECGEVAMGNLGTWAVRLHQLKIPIFEFIDDRLSLVHSMDRIEVIGNIYEIPELLEVE